jgi:hypothetical protein
VVAILLAEKALLPPQLLRGTYIDTVNTLKIWSIILTANKDVPVYFQWCVSQNIFSFFGFFNRVD